MDAEVLLALRPVAHVARVERRDAVDDHKAAAGRDGALGKVEVLGERDVGEFEFARERRPVGQAAPQHCPVRREGVHLEMRHQPEEAHWQGGDVGDAAGDGLDLRAHAVRLEVVVFVPVQNHVAAGSANRRGALPADGVKVRQGDEAHHEAPAGVVAVGRRRRVVARDLKAGILGAQDRLDGAVAVVDQEGLQRPIVLVLDLLERVQRRLGAVAC